MFKGEKNFVTYGQATPEDFSAVFFEPVTEGLGVFPTFPGVCPTPDRLCPSGGGWEGPPTSDLNTKGLPIDPCQEHWDRIGARGEAMQMKTKYITNSKRSFRMSGAAVARSAAPEAQSPPTRGSAHAPWPHSRRHDACTAVGDGCARESSHTSPARLQAASSPAHHFFLRLGEWEGVPPAPTPGGTPWH